MIETPSCAQLAAGAIPEIYAFLKSDQAHLVFGLVTAMRVVGYYGGRSAYPETIELAATLIAALLVGVFVAIAQSPVPTLVKQVVFCQAPEAQDRIALRKFSHSGKDS